MRTWLLTLVGVCAFTYGHAQAFLGLYGTENSVTQIKDNPGFAVHDDRAQLNFISVGLDVGGNSLLFRKHAFGFFDSGKLAMDKDYVRSNNGQPNKMFWGNMEIMGPGAAFLVKKRYFFAVTTGIRYLVNSDNLDSRVFNLLGANAPKQLNIVDSYQVNNYSLTAQVFSELNLSYAGYIYASEEYNLVGGITAKVLSGIGAAGVGIPSASFKTYNNDGYARDLTGTANIAFTPYANKWAIGTNPLQAYPNAANNLGLGIDMGLVYYMNPSDEMIPPKGYLHRLAASITDIGSISYSAASTTGSYKVTNKNIDYRGMANDPSVTFGNRIFGNYLADTTAVATGTARKFKVGLPTALHLNGDFLIEGRFWLNGNVLINLRQPSADYYSNHYITTFTVTPRYSFGRVGVSLPFSFNVQKQGFLGAVIFYGPVYAGTNSLYQMALSNSINNMNFFFGSHLRIKPRRQKEKEMMMM